MKHVIRMMRELESEVVGVTPEFWPAVSKVLWRLQSAVNRDIGEKNSPASFFRERLADIQHAVNMQSLDEALWGDVVGRQKTIQEAYLQESLRALHRVIENDEPEEALSLLRGRLDT